MKKKKVAIIDPLGGHGSSHHYYLFGQALGLERQGVCVSIYTCDETSLDFQQGSVKLFYKKIYAKSPKWVLGIRYLIGTIRSLVDVLWSSVSFAHFHLFQVKVLELFNVVLFKVFGRKIVVTIHDIEAFSHEKGVVRNLLYSLSDKIIVHNQFSKKELLLKNETLEKKINVIPHGNYLPFLKKTITPEQARTDLGLKSSEKVILFFGMIKEVKGLEVLLNAVSKAIKKDEAIKLLIAGKAWKTDFSKYQAIIDELKIQNHCIVHHRFIPDEEVERYYAAADIVALPYKKIYQSGVLLMSMSYETPVLVSDLDPMKEIIDDKVTGFLFNSEDANDLSEKLLLTLSDKEKLNSIQLAAFDKLQETYDWKKIGEQLEKVYT